MDTVSSEQLEEIIGRLATLERKIDWVARRISRDGYPARGSAERPQPRSAQVASPPVRPSTSQTSSSSTAAAPAVQQPRTPALATYPPAKPFVKASTAPSHNAPAAVAPSGSTSAVGGDPFIPRNAQAQQERAQEGNVGRYVLSGAAALLIVSAAVSLIALVWDQIPDVVKVTALGAVAVTLVAAGTAVNKTRERLRVAAATSRARAVRLASWPSSAPP